MIRLIYIAITLLSFACKSHKTITEQTTSMSVKQDSVVYIDRVKIDTIKIPSEVIKVQVPYEVFKTDTVIIYQKGRAQTKIKSHNGLLSLDMRCDSLEKLVLSTEKLVLKQRNENDRLIERSRHKEIIVNPVKWYYKASLFIVVALLIVLLLFLFIKHINPLSRFT
ncbi:MAG: hypothetical protein N4A35_05400 [Flavobacteriales bacterium]|jgi:hypothetical protein|nr:hypothetical protein [Flavobacteriales bacterium]